MDSVALTGGIGSGKSEVARRFAVNGAVIIDSDEIARQVVEPGSLGLAEVVAAFGEGVLARDGSLDRAVLGEIVFADPSSRLRLEAITHPRIAEESTRRLAVLPAGSIVIHDIPLLVERGLAAGYRAVVVVEAPRQLRLARLAARGLGSAEALSRMAAQATDEQRRLVATHLIDNSGSLAALRNRVDQIWAEFRALAS